MRFPSVYYIGGITYFPIKKAAAMYGLTPNRLQRLVRAGRVTGWKIPTPQLPRGFIWAVSEPALQEYLAAYSVPIAARFQPLRSLTGYSFSWLARICRDRRVSAVKRFSPNEQITWYIDTDDLARYIAGLPSSNEERAA